MRSVLVALAVFSAFQGVAHADSYDNWFTDADQLQVPREARQWLDRALSNHDPELIASLPVEETIQATPAELATLLNDVSRAGFGARQGQWAADTAANKLARTPDALVELYRRFQLQDFMDRFPKGSRQAFVSALLPRLVSAPVIGEMILPLVIQDSDDSRRLAHQLMDHARQAGLAAEVRRILAGNESLNGHVAEFINEAFPPRLPLIIAHRGGDSPIYPENTLELVQSTLREGIADGIEIDISVTKDGVPILWHDIDPNSLVSKLRALGLEGDTFKPSESKGKQGLLRAVWEVSFRHVSKLFHYVRSSDGQTVSYAPPKLADVLRAVHDIKPDLKLILLDIKVPATQTDALQAIVNDAVRMVTEYPFQGRIVMLHTQTDGVKFLDARAQGRYDVSHDFEVAQPISSVSKYVKLARQAQDERADYFSFGRPVVSNLGFDGYFEAIRDNMDWLQDTGSDLKFMAWTINSDLEWRSLMGLGVHAILTDQVPAMRALVNQYR